MVVALQYSLKSGELIPPAAFFFLKIALAIQGLLRQPLFLALLYVYWAPRV